MQIDLAGQVNAFRLAVTKALLPLFEAVVNSVQAVEERNPENGLIEITIRRSSLFVGGDDSDSQPLADIEGFEISDNGVGFTDRHYTSFDTSHSTLKASIGGKGVGRLVWLKAFESASVESVYEDGGKWFRRRFKFVMSKQGTEENVVEPVEKPPAEPRTVVRLNAFKTAYREAAPKRADTIAQRIVEHCLVMYMLDNMPRVLITDSTIGSTIDLENVYKSVVQGKSEARRFLVKGHEFTIIDVLLRASAEAENAIHFCANKREVESLKLADVIAHAENPIKDDGVELRYAACISGPLLDQSLNSERTAFVFSRANELALGESNVTWDEIKSAAIEQAADFLKPRLEEARKKALERVEEFIDAEEPRYRILLEHRKNEIENISGNITDERLELELHRILSSWRHEAKADAVKKLKNIPDDAESFAKFKDDFRSALGELSEVAKADLADYVVHRRTVLDFFAKILGVMETGEFSREDVLHGLFFPMRTTSSKVDYDDHNLWLLDERLAYHHYLASDVALKKQEGAPVKSTSDMRPDLLIFNKPLSFSEEELKPYHSVVIVEFKKPERKDYTSSSNPVQQVIDYIRELREGKAKYPNGSSIEKLPNTTRFYCHVVATVTPRLREILEDLNFQQTADGDGFYLYYTAFNAMIEVTGYTKVLHDAVKRNKAFFDKLGLHTSAKAPS
ncbi:MAG TPA: hypothetical protein VII66_04515 [Gemmatimonadaceae bacterium]